MKNTKYQLVRTKSLDNPPYIRITELTVEAFINEPLWTALYPTEKQRNLIVPWVFQKRIEILAEYSYVYIDTETNEVIGHVACAPPHFLGDSVWMAAVWLMWMGIWKYAWLFGINAFMEFIKFNLQWENYCKDAIPDFDNCWSINALVVDEKLRGKGIGSDLMRLALETTIPEGARVILTTQEERNVGFYEKLGFKTIDKRLFYNYKFTNWSMELQL